MMKPAGTQIIDHAIIVAMNSWELSSIELTPHQINMARLKMIHSPQSWWDAIPDYQPLSRVAKDLLIEAKEKDEGDEQRVPV